MTTKMLTALLDACVGGRPTVHAVTRQIRETIHQMRPRDTVHVGARPALTRRETEMLMRNLGARRR